MYRVRTRAGARLGVPFVVVCLLLGVALVSPSSANAQRSSDASIMGRVVDPSGTPVADVPVRVIGLDRSTTSSEDGRFSISGIPAGSWLIEARGEQFGQASLRVTLEAGDRQDVTLELRPFFHLDGIVVSAGPLAARADELYQSVSLLERRDLDARLQPTLGEMLDGEPGIRSTYNGPGAASPVIRGLTGDRVRVLESGLGQGDVSTTSPDHAIAIDPSTAERVEIIRGPATLLYGSSAIGGVVNVFDGRIPNRNQGPGVSGSVFASGGSVSDERLVSGDVSFQTGAVAFRFSGSFRDTDDFSIPGFAELGHEDEHDHEEEEEHEEEEVEGILANSAVETNSFSAGASWIGERGHVGVAVSGFESVYGVPGHGHEEEGEHEEEEEEEEEGISIDLVQRRVDFDSELRFDTGFLERLRLRAGVSDYEHAELEGDGIGTTFVNDQWETRAEIRHRPIGPLTGSFGFQMLEREFEAVGDEAFTPPSFSRSLALFTFQEATAGRLRFQVGSRVERGTVEDQEIGRTRTFTGVSVSGGIRISPSDPLSVALSVSRSVKLPTAEELYSDGAHLGTRSFEIGDPTLDEEVGTSGELTVHVHSGALQLQVTGFTTRFSGFIYPSITGNIREGLTEVRYAQDDATFYGLEGEATLEVFERGDDHIALSVMGDVVRATLRDTDQPLPRIPASAIGFGAMWEGAVLGASATARRVAAQDRLAPFETRTPGYTMMDAEVRWRGVSGGVTHEIALQGRNLLDRDARAHTSFIKDLAPMPGRDVRVTYRLRF